MHSGEAIKYEADRVIYKKDNSIIVTLRFREIFCEIFEISGNEINAINTDFLTYEDFNPNRYFLGD